MLSTVPLFFTFLYHWHCVSLLLLLLLLCVVQTMANILSFMRQLRRIPTESTDTAAGTVMVMAFLFFVLSLLVHRHNIWRRGVIFPFAKLWSQVEKWKWHWCFCGNPAIIIVIQQIPTTIHPLPSIFHKTTDVCCAPTDPPLLLAAATVLCTCVPTFSSNWLLLMLLCTASLLVAFYVWISIWRLGVDVSVVGWVNVRLAPATWVVVGRSQVCETGRTVLM